MKTEKLIELAKKYRYPLLVLALGIGLLLVPTQRKSGSEVSAEDERLCMVLTSTAGVGESRVLISEHGVVVVCQGADNAEVRLEILRAVRSYTGFGSDKITILKLAES